MKREPLPFTSKRLIKKNRLVSCIAYRTGTNNISAVLSTKFHGHQWEGICLNPKQQILYEEDPENGLDSLLFVMIGPSPFAKDHEDEMKLILEELSIERIDVLTSEQGSADWHKGRQFSLTSSQADGSFRMAFIIHQSDDDWCSIAQFLYGNDYHEGELKTKSFYFIISNLSTYSHVFLSSYLLDNY